MWEASSRQKPAAFVVLQSSRSRENCEKAVLLLNILETYPVWIQAFWAKKMPEQSNDYRVVVFGAGGVGKTSLVHRFIQGTFRESYVPTIEDTYRKVSLAPFIFLAFTWLNDLAFFQVISSNKSICTLHITDTTGSHQFPAMQRLSISKGHAFILVFSICSRQSLEELKPILELINEVNIHRFADCMNSILILVQPPSFT